MVRGGLQLTMQPGLNWGTKNLNSGYTIFKMSSITAVGFDVGLRNLGMAIVRLQPNEQPPYKCLKLELIDLNSRVVNEAVYNMVAKLCDLWDPWLKDVHHVNIEQQPEKQHFGGPNAAARNKMAKDNTQMKSIAHALQGFFLGRGKPVVFISAKSKLTVYEGPPIELKTKSTKEYYVRKLMSIAHAKAILEDMGQHEWLDYVKKLDKKDDVCDAYLQCIYSLQHCV